MFNVSNSDRSIFGRLLKSTSLRSIHLLIAVFCSFYSFGQLSGTYTIGGSSPDYTNVGSAVWDLYDQGISGPVQFHIRSGVYSERIEFKGSIPGTNSNDTILFRNQPNSNAIVTLAQMRNKVIQISNGAGFLTFDSLQFESVGTICNVALISSPISFRNSVFYEPDNQHLYSLGNLGVIGLSVYCDKNSSTKFTFEHNLIVNLGLGINYGGNNKNSCSFSIFQNDFKLVSTAIVCNGARNGKITGNTILLSQKGSETSAGIRLDYSDSIDVISNKIIGLASSSSMGMHFNNVSGGVLNRIKVMNNMVSVVGNYGICNSFNSCDYSDFINNSFLGVKPSNRVVSISGDSVNFINNAIYSHSSAYGLTFSSTVKRSNNAISGLIQGGSLGTNSIQINPDFTSNFDLHLASAALDGKGIPFFSGLVPDIDGDIRNPLYPDIGADERSFPTNDIGVMAFYAPPTCAGNVPVQVKIKNAGANSITSAQINWSISTNGGTPVVQTPISFTGNLGIAKDSLLVVGNLSISASNTYEVKIYSSVPNGRRDINPSNDTLVFTRKSALQGVYSIGTTASDFTSFKEALQSMENNGICGSVLFNVKSGLYNENLHFKGNIQRRSTSNSIRFRSAPVNTNRPTLKFDKDYVIKIDEGANNISFDSLIIDGTGSKNVIFFEGIVKNISIKGNKIIGTSMLNRVEFSALVINKFNDTLKNFTFEDNEMLGSDIGIQLSRLSSFQIRNNSFITKGNRVGFSIGGEDGIVSNNEIDIDGDPNNQLTGLAVGGKHIHVEANRIIVRTGYYSTGIGIALKGTSLKKCRISNNMITVLGDQIDGSMNLVHYCEYAEIDHNSFYGSTSDTLRNKSLVQFYRNSPTTKFRNNSAFNNGNGYTLHIENTDTTSYVGNNFYGLDSSLLFKNRKLTSGFISVNPDYVSPVDLHINSPLLDGKGSSIGVVTTDFEGDSRNTTSPDIGADEHVFERNDIGVSMLEIAYNCSGQMTPIKARIKNYGTNSINTLDVNWKIQTGSSAAVSQPKLKLNLKLDIGEDTTVVLGNKVFELDSIYTLYAYSDLPNNTTDRKNSNDSAKKQFSVGMQGVYKIGAGEEFNTIKEAIHTLYQRGVCDSVSFELKKGTYNEKLLFSGPIQGASKRNVIRFRTDPSEQSRTTIHSDSTYAIRIDNKAAYITFQRLNIICKGPTVVELSENSHISFYNNHLRSLDSNTRYWRKAIIEDIYLELGVTKNLTLINNKLINGNIGVYLHGYTIRQGWNSTTIYTDSFLIQGNSFENIRSNGLYLYQCSNGRILNNQFSVHSEPGAYAIAINMIYQKNVEILSNTFNIHNNDLGIGLFLNYVSTSSSKARSLVANNMISHHKKGTTNSIGNFIQGCENIDVVHNSFYGKATSKSKNGLINIGGCKNSTFSNNSIFNDWEGVALVTDGSTTNSNNNLFGNNGTSNIRGASQGINGVNVNPGYVSSASGDLHVKTNALDQKGTLVSMALRDFDDDPRDLVAPDIGADEFFDGKDLAVVHVTPRKVYCNSTSDTIDFEIKNRGIVSLNVAVDSFQSQWNVSNVNVQSGTFNYASGMLASNEAISGWFVSDFSKAGTFDIKLKIDAPYDQNPNNDSLVEVYLGTTPKIKLLTPNEYCENDSLVISVKPSTGVLTWYKDPNYTTTIDTSFRVNLGVSMHDTIVYLLLKDTKGCINRKPEFIKFNKNPTPDLGPDTSFCKYKWMVLRPKNQAKSYKWNNNDRADSLVIRLKGKYWIQVTDSNSCIGSDTIQVTYGTCVGIDESLLSSSTILYYPNPNNGRFSLKLNAEFEGRVELVIRNMQGQMVSTQSWEKTSTDLLQEIDLSNYPTGMYLLDLKTPMGRAQHRITLDK